MNIGIILFFSGGILVAAGVFEGTESETENRGRVLGVTGAFLVIVGAIVYIASQIGVGSLP